MFSKQDLSQFFLLLLLAASLYLVYLFFKPFLMVILLSGVLVSIFYSWYEWVLPRLQGKRSWAALIMVVVIAVIIILPVTLFIFYLSKKSLEGFSAITVWINSGAAERTVNQGLLSRFSFIDVEALNLRQYLVSASSRIYSFLLSGGTSLLKGTTQLFTSLILMFFTMFFLFRDGKTFMREVMHLTPLPNKYDRKIFQKFRDVSYSTITSTFVTAIVQGIIGSVGFMIVGIPAFFAGVAMAFLALLPYVGATFVWLPAGLYLLLTGKIWQGIFILIWGSVVVSLVDNILRPMLIKNKAQIHPLIIFFAIFGGILTFGFWGMILGPIIISIAFTILHIYELEYADVLEEE
ncbi:AI-2E family transporter [Candidatus Falkowbacteria bacterium]|nr:AI-2E family transporter [Candidatus Falkowbacteria bacterium]